MHCRNRHDRALHRETDKLAASWQLDRSELLLVVLFEGGAKLRDDAGTLRRQSFDIYYVDALAGRTRRWRTGGGRWQHTVDHVCELRRGQQGQETWGCLPLPGEPRPQTPRLFPAVKPYCRMFVFFFARS